MKIVIYMLFFFISSQSYSQTTEQKLYKAEGVYLIKYGLNGSEDLRKPEGRKVSIKYDLFFKSFRISYFDIDDELSTVKFEYIMDEKDGSVRMKDTFDKLFTVINRLDTDGILRFRPIDSDNSNDMIWVVIEQAKQINQ